ncbi:hypothetical protein Avbf_08130 [Armadillidium vulgare]|nr:hypothetical protein Avbf_08130 [Armadillidium vulgare]
MKKKLQDVFELRFKVRRYVQSSFSKHCEIFSSNGVSLYAPTVALVSITKLGNLTNIFFSVSYGGIKASNLDRRLANIE